ncbi:hypothetical protein FA15DRAFT_683067 [Coprinopsis marcescibilis]|uniref:Secreted protein n=1 Tax=Coprinopsis marcescibilis TaxID=230819 RepID=A0A5C3KG26_COPMA|nr:hypothetical protein FA15DRAFT_683067 [Coprinopsis marcescibilis]
MSFATFTRLALALYICVLQVAAAPTAEAAPELQITSVGAIGTGCPPGTTSARVNKDDSVSLFFSQFRADAGPSYDLSDGRTNCRLTLGVNIPAGYQFAFDQSNLNAYYHVESKVKATAESYYYFQGQLTEGTCATSITGPSTGQTTLVNKYSPLVWSPCGSAGVVNINNALLIDNGATKSVGSIAVRNSTEASFVWRRC